MRRHALAEATVKPHTTNVGNKKAAPIGAA